MKKAWKAALLATFAVGAIAVSGCGGGSGSSGGGDLPQIGMAIYKFDDTFMSGVRARIEADAKGKAKVDIVDSQNSQPTQNEKIDLFINKKYKAIGVNVVDRPAAGVIIDKAKAANIPLVFMNREPTPEDMKKWDKVYYVGAKAEQSGEMQGKILADYFKKQMDEITGRIKTYDNNLGFFKTSSKGVNPFMKEIEDKINAEKQKISELNEKRKLVMSELNKLKPAEIEKK